MKTKPNDKTPKTEATVDIIEYYTSHSYFSPLNLMCFARKLLQHHDGLKMKALCYSDMYL